LNKTDTIVKH